MLSATTIAFITLGCVVLLVILGGAIVCCICVNKNKKMRVITPKIKERNTTRVSGLHPETYLKPDYTDVESRQTVLNQPKHHRRYPGKDIRDQGHSQRERLLDGPRLKRRKDPGKDSPVKSDNEEDLTAKLPSRVSDIQNKTSSRIGTKLSNNDVNTGRTTSRRLMQTTSLNSVEETIGLIPLDSSTPTNRFREMSDEDLHVHVVRQNFIGSKDIRKGHSDQDGNSKVPKTTIINVASDSHKNKGYYGVRKAKTIVRDPLSASRPGRTTV